VAVPDSPPRSDRSIRNLLALAIEAAKSDDEAHAAELLDRIDPCPYTARELEVLQLIADGHRNKQIALRTSMSPHTVSQHLENMIEKTPELAATTRTALAVHALRKGWIT
jgi:DNA-binding NarL/FixJ family response regulator